jgi:hypothetical protein
MQSGRARHGPVTTHQRHGGVTALALHPDPGVGVLYGVARSQRGVGMYELNNDLEPDAPVQIATFGSSSGSDDVAVSANGQKLYTGTANCTLQVVDLGPDGKPVTGATVATVPMGPSPEPAQRSLRFLITANAVYRRPHFETLAPAGLEPAGFQQWPLVSVALDCLGCVRLPAVHSWSSAHVPLINPCCQLPPLLSFSQPVAHVASTSLWHPLHLPDTANRSSFDTPMH